MPQEYKTLHSVKLIDVADALNALSSDGYDEWQLMVELSSRRILDLDAHQRVEEEQLERFTILAWRTVDPP